MCSAGLKYKTYKMEKLNRGDKIYLDDKAKTKESTINTYLACRDGIVEVFEYNDMSGYGSKTRLFLCENAKHEVTSIVRHTWNDFAKEWIEEEMTFDTDSFVFLKALINNKKEELGGKYYLVRDY
jgi:hypothetical protein